jgi:hypothetical protein
MLDDLRTTSGKTIATKSTLAPYATLTFSMALAIFVLGPPLLSYPFGLYPLMHVADILDLFTPLVLLPLYWLLFYLNGDRPATIKANLTFMIFSGFWVLGQSMHLAANSIGHLTENMNGTDIYKLTYFYDETLGHYLWHFGLICLSALLMYRQRKKSLFEVKEVNWFNIIAGVIYGFVFFAMVNEGSTVPMGLPFSIMAIIFILFWERRKLKQPITSLFLTGYSFALLLFAVWGIWHQGFPGFFEIGLVK